MSGSKNIANPFSETGRFIRQAGATAVYGMGGAWLAPAGDWLAQGAGINLHTSDALNSAVFNGGKSAATTRDEAAAVENDKENTARAAAYNDALAGDNLDEISRQEVLKAYQSGSSSADLASTLATAREGKGIYAVRKINQNMKTIQTSTPGRSQLMTLGNGTSLI
jgi:hypothetical protein